MADMIFYVTPGDLPGWSPEVLDTGTAGCCIGPSHDWRHSPPPGLPVPSSFPFVGILGPAIAMALLFNVIEARD